MWRKKMRITIIGKNYFFKDTLPKKFVENYWVIDKNQENGKKLLNLIGTNENWELISNNCSKCICFPLFQ